MSDDEWAPDEMERRTMTKTEANLMNAAIATKVMGWQLDPRDRFYWLDLTGRVVACNRNGVNKHVPFWNPLENRAHAMMVLERLVADDADVCMMTDCHAHECASNGRHLGEWGCQIDSSSNFEAGHSLMEALVRGALKYKKWEETPYKIGGPCPRCGRRGGLHHGDCYPEVRPASDSIPMERIEEIVEGVRPRSPLMDNFSIGKNAACDRIIAALRKETQ